MSVRPLSLVLSAFAILAVGGGLVWTNYSTSAGQGKLHVEAASPAPASLLLANATLSAPVPPAARQLPVSHAQVQLSFASVVKHVAPAVVNVYATTITRQSASPFFNDPLFGQLFGRGSPFARTHPRESQSLGSGVIIDPKGIIITNSHVVNGATDVKVALQDGREYDVKVLVNDPKTDLAVLKIKGAGDKTFPALKFADSDRLEVGDMVLAIGNPFGVGQTVTSGIVSALARTGVERSHYESFIQTDAAINPGNSGGALVDLNGNLVGINTALVSKSGGSIGIGFAIPANMARAVAEDGINGGKIVRPWFGARMQVVTPDIADSLGINPHQGAMITDVAANGPAAQAGLKSGDVILAIDGVPVAEPQAVDFRLATKPVGGTADFQYLRNGKKADTQVRLEAAPGAGVAPVAISGNTRFAGTKVSELTPALSQDMGLAFDAKGVVVTDIAPGSPADQMGLEKGDIITSLNGIDIKDVGTFKKLASTRPRGWQIVIQRNGQMIRSYIDG